MQWQRVTLHRGRLKVKKSSITEGDYSIVKSYVIALYISFMSLRGRAERKSWKRVGVAAVAGWWPVSWFAKWSEEKHCSATCSEIPAEETQVLATTSTKILTLVPKVPEPGSRVTKLLELAQICWNMWAYWWANLKCRGASKI